MTDEVHDFSKYEKIGQSLEQIAEDTYKMENGLKDIFHSFRIDNNLGYEDIEDPALKEKLANKIADAMLMYLQHSMKLKTNILEEPEEYQDQQLMTYFQTSRTQLLDQFKRSKRITAKMFDGMIEEWQGHFSQQRSSYHLNKLGPEDLDVGKQYLSKVAKQYGIAHDPDSILEIGHVKQRMFQYHRQKWAYQRQDQNQ